MENTWDTKEKTIVSLIEIVLKMSSWRDDEWWPNTYKKLLVEIATNEWKPTMLLNVCRENAILKIKSMDGK
jgi:hypothetical protein